MKLNALQRWVMQHENGAGPHIPHADGSITIRGLVFQYARTNTGDWGNSPESEYVEESRVYNLQQARDILGY